MYICNLHTHTTVYHALDPVRAEYPKRTMNNERGSRIEDQGSWIVDRACAGLASYSSGDGVCELIDCRSRRLVTGWVERSTWGINRERV